MFFIRVGVSKGQQRAMLGLGCGGREGRCGRRELSISSFLHAETESESETERLDETMEVSTSMMRPCQDQSLCSMMRHLHLLTSVQTPGFMAIPYSIARCKETDQLYSTCNFC